MVEKEASLTSDLFPYDCNRIVAQHYHRVKAGTRVAAARIVSKEPNYATKNNEGHSLLLEEIFSRRGLANDDDDSVGRCVHQ